MQATLNLQKARAAVDESFTTISENKLLDVPGLQPLRKDLLESALRFYQDFALERSDDPRAMADLAVTYLRVSQINTALDRNDDAIVAVRQALDIVDRLRREHPKDLESPRKLAGFCTERRWTQYGTDLPRNPLVAFQTMLRLETTWEKLAAEHPSVVAFQSDLMAIDTALGALLHSSGRPKDGAKYFHKAVAIGERLLAEDPTVPRYRSALADVSLQLAGNRTATGQADEALALARRAVELDEALVAEFPGVAAYRWSLVVGLVALGDGTAANAPKQAEEYYQRGVDLARSLLGEFPSHRLYQESWSRAALQWGKFLHAQGRREQAAQVFQGLVAKSEELIAVRPRDPQARAGLASDCFYVAERVPEIPNQAAITESLYRQALVLFSELAGEFPGVHSYLEHDGHCHVNLGRIDLEANHLDDALRHVRSAVVAFEKLAGEQPREKRYTLHLSGTCRFLSIILQRQHKSLDALRVIESAIRLDPHSVEHQLRLLDVLNEIDDDPRRSEALSLLTRMLRDKPNDEIGWRVRGEVHAAMGRIDEAAAAFVQAIDLSEDTPFWWSPRRFACRALARWDKVFERVAELRPEEPTLWIGRAQFRALHSQWAEAASDYAKVIHTRRLNEESADYATLLLLLSDRSGYQRFCKELVAQAGEPQGFEAYSLARVCSIGRPEGIDAQRVVDLANRGMGDRPPWALTVLGMAEYRAGQFDRAIEHFRESNTLRRGWQLRARNYFGLAMAHHRLGQVDAARECLEKARQFFERVQPASPGGTPPLDDAAEWIEQHVLSREAEALLQSSSDPSPEPRDGR
jgi:tetratricopeptide (TPR) repeat protein